MVTTAISHEADAGKAKEAAQAEIDLLEPVRVGLRPLRPANVRLERETGTRIIHNYGHGGSGVTFSWGCAEEVAETIEQLLSERDSLYQHAMA